MEDDILNTPDLSDEVNLESVYIDIWYGETYDRINEHLKYTDMQYPYIPNEDLIYIIEHGSVN